MAEMSSLPSTPVPSIGSGSNFFESTGLNANEESNMWDIGQASPGSKRCPTFKDYSEKIKQLQQENFQLRVRVFLCEQKTGVKNSSSDFAVLFQQNMQQLQNAFNANNASNAPHSMPGSTSSSNEISASQLNSLKTQNGQLISKVMDLEQKIVNYESALKEKQTENEQLQERNEVLAERLGDMETEFTLTKSKLQQQINQTALSRTANEEEVERGAEIAFGFGQYEDEMNQHKQELEAMLTEESNKVRQLEKRVTKMKRELTKLADSNSNLETERKGYQNKLVECSKVFVDLGKRNVQLSQEIEELKLAHAAQVKDLKQAKPTDSAVNAVREQYNDVREMVGLLQGRIFDIISFIEALLSLESKKILTIAGLNEENRDGLRVSVQQCRHLSQNLDKLFQSADESMLLSKKLRRIGGLNFSNNDDSITYKSHNYERRDDAGDLSPVRKQGDIGVQCDLPASRGMSLTADKSISKLRRDLERSESKRKELLAEQTNLRSQIEALKSNLKLSHAKIETFEKTCQTVSNLDMENKTLLERLAISDLALRKLHQEHAKLVAQLKDMKSIQESLSHEKLHCSSYMESERPSDTTSPDLGIDSGHDGATNSDDNHSNNYKCENKMLRKTNMELAMKLRQTRQTLQNTLEKLHSTTKQKEEVEKAICRQLHKTHTILRQAKKSVEKFTISQCQENIVPSLPS